MGLAFGCVASPPILDSLGKTSTTHLLALTMCGAAIATMLPSISNIEVNLVLTCICQTFIGASFMIALLANIKHLAEVLATKT